jgi:hypothetical protein
MQEHGHQVAQQHDTEQFITEFCAAAEIRGPVAGIHVADGDQVAGSGKSKKFAQPGSGGVDGNAAMRLRQGGIKLAR